MIDSNEQLMQELKSLGYIKTQRIEDAFLIIDRKMFVPEKEHAAAYVNEPLALGYQQTISQPLVVAFMLELLEVRPGEKILEIGTGSGWQTALLSYLACDRVVDGEGLLEKIISVVSLERIHELHEQAKQNIERYPVIAQTVLLLEQDGMKGCSEQGVYDKIICGASARHAIPQAWKDQLKIGGRIVAPIGKNIVVLDKKAKDDFSQREFFGYSFVPLVES